jgi:hypothetical protein
MPRAMASSRFQLPGAGLRRSIKPRPLKGIRGSPRCGESLAPCPRSRADPLLQRHVDRAAPAMPTRSPSLWPSVRLSVTSCAHAAAGAPPGHGVPQSFTHLGHYRRRALHGAASSQPGHPAVESCSAWVIFRRDGPRRRCKPSRHGLGPRDVSFEAKRFRHRAVAPH